MNPSLWRFRNNPSRPRPSGRLAIFLVSVFAHLPSVHADFFAPNPSLETEAKSAQYAILELLDFRTVGKLGVAELLEYRRTHSVFRGDQLESIHQNVVARAKIKDELVARIAPYLPLVNNPRRVDTPEELFHYLMTMAIGYTLVDNYAEFVAEIQNDDHLRRIVNEDNSSFGKAKDLLRRATADVYSIRFHRPTVRGARRFDELSIDLDQSLLADADLRFFWAVIENSATFRMLRDQNSSERVLYDIGFFLRGIFGGKKMNRDRAYAALKDTIDAVSKAFGNTIGKFQSRRGMLYENPALEKILRGDLRAGDILLEKTPFRLTDKFIPGYWGHNAIWLGTEAELKFLGIWDAPEILPLQEEIRAGRSVLEALRPGVMTNSLGHFLDVDSYAVMRRKAMGDEELRRVILRAARQYGKEYDFGFDVETQDRLVCSELMYMTYTDVPFRLERALGRMTINPDAIAEQALPGEMNPFMVVRLIVDGEWVPGNQELGMQLILEPAI